MRKTLGSCGETSELTASRIHAWASLVMGICLVAEMAAVLLHGVMSVWHFASVKTHSKRAGEHREL